MVGHPELAILVKEERERRSGPHNCRDQQNYHYLIPYHLHKQQRYSVIVTRENLEGARSFQQIQKAYRVIVRI